jgi:putative polyketide hydroxylase
VCRLTRGGGLGRRALDAYRVGADVIDTTGGLETSYGTGAAGAVLVRPDGFIAWRASASHADPESELAHALGTALGHSVVSGAWL